METVGKWEKCQLWHPSTLFTAGKSEFGHAVHVCVCDGRGGNHLDDYGANLLVSPDLVTEQSL